MHARTHHDHQWSLNETTQTESLLYVAIDVLPQPLGLSGAL